MKNSLFLLPAVLSVLAAQAGSPASADYTVTADIIDSAGQRSTSTDGVYINDGSTGAIGGTASIPGATVRQGYLGQLYELLGYGLLASTFYPPEGGATQLITVRTADDGSNFVIPTTGFTFGVVSGPLTGVSPTGLVTAGLVYENTYAEVRATSVEFPGDLRLPLYVQDTVPDNFGRYAGDGLPDDWQVRYFGLDNPLAAPGLDPDGDGQSNLFEFTAGLNPTDANSRFHLEIQPGLEPGEKRLLFGPIQSGCSYSILGSGSLSGEEFTPLVGLAFSDDGATRTVTDSRASVVVRYYRVLISRP